jgi:hypothetical protein
MASLMSPPPIPVFIHLRTWPNMLCSPSSGSRRREPLQRLPLTLHICSRSSDRRAHGRPMRRCRVHGWPPRCRALLMFPVNAPGLHSPPFSVRSSPGARTALDAGLPAAYEVSLRPLPSFLQLPWPAPSPWS